MEISQAERKLGDCKQQLDLKNYLSKFICKKVNITTVIYLKFLLAIALFNLLYFV